VQRPGSRNLYLRWFDKAASNGKGNGALQSLGHDDIEEGKDEADDAAKIFRKGGSPLRKNLTVTELLVEYRTVKSLRKKDGQQASDLRRTANWLTFLGAAREAMTVDPDTCAAYVQHRRDQGVGDTTIGHEIVFLRGVFDWALTRRTASGAPLLPMNPIAKVKRIRSADPVTPVATDEDFLRIYRQADRVDSQKLFRPFLMLIREHGWRLSAWCKLSLADIDLKPRTVGVVTWPHGAIRKDRSNDKKGKGDWVPMTRRSRRAAILLFRRRKAEGDLPAFLSPLVSKPWSPFHAHAVLERAEARATASGPASGSGGRTGQAGRVPRPPAPLGDGTEGPAARRRRGCRGLAPGHPPEPLPEGRPGDDAPGGPGTCAMTGRIDL
jgi:integrase